MLAIARRAAPGAQHVLPLVLPDDPVPQVDAVVGIGHALNYLPDLAAIHRGLAALADALRPGGVFAIDLCDPEWARLREGAAPHARVDDDWAIITRFSQPEPGRFDRDITTFVRTPSGEYRRREEYHRNVMVDAATVPDLLREHGVVAHVGTTFDDLDNPLPRGLRTVVGWRSGDS